MNTTNQNVVNNYMEALDTINDAMSLSMRDIIENNDISFGDQRENETDNQHTARKTVEIMKLVFSSENKHFLEQKAVDDLKIVYDNEEYHHDVLLMLEVKLKEVLANSTKEESVIAIKDVIELSTIVEEGIGQFAQETNNEKAALFIRGNKFTIKALNSLLTQYE